MENTLKLSPDSILNKLEPYVYGTMSLGHDEIPFEDRLEMARYAMDNCKWFHTSHKYGSTIDVLAEAFRERPGHVPLCMFKLSGDDMGEIRRQIELQLKALNLPRLDIGQVHMGGALAEDFMAGGNCLDGFRKLREEGLVGGFSLEVHPWTSKVALAHLRGGAGRDVFEAYTFYFNPLQRYALNELFELIVKERRPILALRTVAGGPVERQAARQISPDDFMQQRAAELLPLYRSSGYANWTDFAMNFAWSQANVLSTIGACSTPAHLDEYLSVLNAPRKPFPKELSQGILDLQTKWSDEKDRFAAEWTM